MGQHDPRGGAEILGVYVRVLADQFERTRIIATIRGSIVVSISDSHAEDPGSMPGPGIRP